MKKLINTRLRPLGAVVLFSVVLVAFTTTLCSAGTIPNRATGVIGTGSLASETGKKSTGRVMHPAFENAGKVKGLEVWRIENFEPVAYAPKDYGKFFTGDSYIVLNTKESKSKQLSWDAHFWLGLETSTDEAGAAAILTVQLDDILNGAPIQHREVQEHESQLFLSYFKNGIRYAAGGVASGFNQVETNAAGEKRLFQVKGKKNVRVRQVNLSISAMNKGDCFILDSGRIIYVYVGSQSKRVEKLKAISAANQIRDQDHNGRATVDIIDEFSSEFDKQKFFEVLGSGSPGEVPDDSTSEDDSDFEKSQDRIVTLYKVSDESGSLKVETISTRPFEQSMLLTSDCFILDSGVGIYVWVGKGATKQEKDQSMAKAQDFIKTKKYPTWTQVHRVVEGAESAPFKQYFATWRDRGMTHSRLIRAANDADSDTAVDDEIDPYVLHTLKKSGGRAIGFMPDNGEGEVEIWRIEDFELVPVAEENYGMFFGGDSYVIKYHYANKRGGQGYVIYYWQGKQSSNDEKASSAIHAVRLDNELNGIATQVRVAQGYEPRHFLKIFKGKMVTFTGGRASAFNNIKDNDTYDVDGIRLFRVRGTSEDDVRADQMAETAASLASADAFILETTGANYIWQGEGASDFEKDTAVEIAKRLFPDDEEVEVITEGSEPAEFWEAIGGEGAYDKELDPPGAPFLDARLFHCKITWNGKFKVEEVNQFEQEDLDVDDIMILDGGDEIYVWVGEGSTTEEREKTMDLAKEYLRTDPSDRSEETVPVIEVKQHHEPRSFKRIFPVWDDELWASLTSYEEAKNKVAESNANVHFSDSD